MMTILIDGRAREICIVDVEAIFTKRAEALVRVLPQLLKPRPFRPTLSYRVRLLMEGWSLTYTVHELLKLNNIAAIDTKHELLYTTSGRPIIADISLAPLSGKETERVQRERLIHAVNTN